MEDNQASLSQEVINDKEARKPADSITNPCSSLLSELREIRGIASSNQAMTQQEATIIRRIAQEVALLKQDK